MYHLTSSGQSSKVRIKLLKVLLHLKFVTKLGSMWFLERVSFWLSHFAPSAVKIMEYEQLPQAIDYNDLLFRGFFRFV